MIDRTTAQLVTAFRRLMSSKRAVQRRLACAGLTLPTGGAIVLDRLVTDGPTRIGDLASAGRCHLSVTSRLVADLVAVGLVAKQTDPLDGRSHLIVVTDLGREYLQHYLDEIALVMDDALAGWTDLERATFAVQLGRLGMGIDRALEQPAAPMDAAAHPAADRSAARAPALAAEHA